MKIDPVPTLDSGCEFTVGPHAPRGAVFVAFAWVLVTLRRRR